MKLLFRRCIDIIFSIPTLYGIILFVLATNLLHDQFNFLQPLLAFTTDFGKTHFIIGYDNSGTTPIKKKSASPAPSVPPLAIPESLKSLYKKKTVVVFFFPRTITCMKHYSI